MARQYGACVQGRVGEMLGPPGEASSIGAEQV